MSTETLKGNNPETSILEDISEDTPKKRVSAIELKYYLSLLKNRKIAFVLLSLGGLSLWVTIAITVLQETNGQPEKRAIWFLMLLLAQYMYMVSTNFFDIRKTQRRILGYEVVEEHELSEEERETHDEIVKDDLRYGRDETKRKRFWFF